MPSFFAYKYRAKLALFCSIDVAPLSMFSTPLPLRSLVPLARILMTRATIPPPSFLLSSLSRPQALVAISVRPSRPLSLSPLSPSSIAMLLSSASSSGTRRASVTPRLTRALYGSAHFPIPVDTPAGLTPALNALTRRRSLKNAERKKLSPAARTRAKFMAARVRRKKHESVSVTLSPCMLQALLVFRRTWSLVKLVGCHLLRPTRPTPRRPTCEPLSR